MKFAAFIVTVAVLPAVTVTESALTSCPAAAPTEVGTAARTRQSVRSHAKIRFLIALLPSYIFSEPTTPLTYCKMRSASAA